MTEPNEPKSRIGCKVILFHRPGGRVRFGVVEAERGAEFPAASFPGLLAIDRELAAFAAESLGLGEPRIHERFVERPDPRGALYYLVEELSRPESPAGSAALPVRWLHAAEVAERVGQADRKALAKAMIYLSGQPPAKA